MTHPRLHLVRFLALFLTALALLPTAQALDCDRALHQLERELLLNPDDPNIQLAYSLILHQCRQPAPKPKSYQISLKPYIGYSTNPDHSSQANYIPLTLGEQDLTLDNPQSPKSSAFQGLTLKLHAQRNQHHYHLEADLQRYSQSHGPAQTPADRQGYLNLTYLHNRQADIYRLNLLQSHNQNQHYNQINLSYGRQLTPAWLIMADYAQRHHPKNPLTDARIATLNLVTQQGPLTLQAQLATDWPQNSQRPGGQANRQQIAAIYRHVQGRHQLQALAQLINQQDQQGYSPLIHNNQPRRTRLQQIQLDWNIHLNRTTQINLQFSHAEQHANHPLFQWHTTELTAGLTYAW